MTNKPNILMIVTDQEYAHQPMPAEFALPNRDRLRGRGVTFNHRVHAFPLGYLHGPTYAAHPHV